MNERLKKYIQFHRIELSEFALFLTNQFYEMATFLGKNLVACDGVSYSISAGDTVVIEQVGYFVSDEHSERDSASVGVSISISGEVTVIGPCFLTNKDALKASVVSLLDLKNEKLTDFTVVGFYEENGQIFSHHVQATSANKAFFQVAQEHPSAEFLTAIEGHLNEGNGIEFCGESVVSADTVLSQSEVFNV